MADATIFETACCPVCTWRCDATRNAVSELARVVVLFEDHLERAHDWTRERAGDHAKNWAASRMNGATVR